MKNIFNFRKPKNEKKSYSLTKRQVINELNRINGRNKRNKIILSTIYSIVIIVAISTVISMLFMPILQISTNSMNPNYNNGDIVVAIKTRKIKSGDVIAFYHGNKILVKRVVAFQSDWVDIDEYGNVIVNGKEIKENYIVSKTSGDYSIKFPYQVPNESYFVLSDDRENNIDSRNIDIGSIKEDQLVGKVLFKIWPLN